MRQLSVFRRRVIIAVLGGIFLVALPVLAAAQGSGLYLAPKFLMLIQDTGHISRAYSDMTDDSYSQFSLGGALAVGYDFYPQRKIPLRAELEFALRGDSEKSWNSTYVGCPVTTKGHWNNSTLLLNLYYDVRTETPFVPYIGAGVGMAFHRTRYAVWAVTRAGEANIHPGGRSTNLAWNVGVGTAYNINENFAVDVGYRFMMLSYNELTFNADGITFRNQPYNHELVVGLRVRF